MSRWRKGIYGALTLLLAFVAAEAGLRGAGFRYQRITASMQFNYPRPDFIRDFFEIDPDLLYRIRRTVKQRGVDLTWQPRFDLKIRDARTFGPKPPGVARIVALGDSSTYGVNTPRPWPDRLQQLLDRRAGPGRFEVLNLGVPGYTAYQGRRLLETRGARLEADAVVISFGWNDHLLALGFTDAQQDVGGAQVVAARNWLQASRVYQALSWLLAAARGGAASGGEGATPGGAGAGPLRRVGPADFRGELEEMIRLVRSLGAIPVLCTYPTALSVMESGGHPAPEWLVETHAGRGGAREVRRLQDAYNDIVRQVGSAAGAPVIDLERAFQEAGKDALFDYPGGDFIHPNEPGYDAVARLVYTTLEGLASRR